MLETNYKEKQKKILKSTKFFFNINFEQNYQDLYYLSTWSKNCGNFLLRKKFLSNGFLFNLIESFKLLYRKIRVENTSYNFIKNFSEKSIIHIRCYSSNDDHVNTFRFYIIF